MECTVLCTKIHAFIYSDSTLVNNSVVITLPCEEDNDDTNNPVRDIVCFEKFNESTSALTPDIIEGEAKVIPKDYFLLMVRNDNNQLRQ